MKEWGDMLKKTLILTALLLGLCFHTSYAATWRVAYIDLDLKEQPHPDSKTLIMVPAGTELKQLGKQGYWIKARYEGKTGWISKAGMELVEGEHKAEISIRHAHSKYFSGMYRHFFYITNNGTAPFKGNVMLKGYVFSKVAFQKTYSYRDDPIPESGGRKIIIDCNSDFNKFDYTIYP